MGMMDFFFNGNIIGIKGWQQFRMLNNGFPDLDQGDKKRERSDRFFLHQSMIAMLDAELFLDSLR